MFYLVIKQQKYREQIFEIDTAINHFITELTVTENHISQRLNFQRDKKKTQIK